MIMKASVMAAEDRSLTMVGVRCAVQMEGVLPQVQRIVIGANIKVSVREETDNPRINKGRAAPACYAFC